MVRYLLGSLIVLFIAYYSVSYVINKSGVKKEEQAVMDVPTGEFDTMGIRQAKPESEGYVLYFNGLRLYQSRTKKGTMCSTDLEIYFPEKKNAKLVMKHRYGVGPYLAMPLKDMTAQQALLPENQYKMINSLKHGYATHYGIKNMTKVILKSFTCKDLQ